MSSDVGIIVVITVRSKTKLRKKERLKGFKLVFLKKKEKESFRVELIRKIN